MGSDMNRVGQCKHAKYANSPIPRLGHRLRLSSRTGVSGGNKDQFAGIHSPRKAGLCDEQDLQLKLEQIAANENHDILTKNDN